MSAAKAPQAPEKQSFVHRAQERKSHKDKSLLALLLLFLSNRKGAVALVVAGALVVFLMLAPFGFDLGRFGDFVGAKPHLAWLANILHSVDHWLAANGFKSSDAAYRDMYTARESDLTWKGALSKEARDVANPESMVAGGKDLLAANEPDAPGGPHALSPDEAKQNSPVVPVDGAVHGDGATEGGKYQLQMGGLGSSAFGGSELFQGGIGAQNGKEALIAKVTSGNYSDLDPGALTKSKAKPGRLSKMSGGAGAGGRGGRRNSLAAGGAYKRKLGVAMLETQASTTMTGEDSALWNRGWATGESSGLGIGGGGLGGGDPTDMGDTGDDSGVSGSAGGSFSVNVTNCADAMNKAGQVFGPLDSQISSDQTNLQALGAPSSCPDCCDGDKIDKWNGIMDDELAQCNQFNTLIPQVQEQCRAVLGIKQLTCNPSDYAHLHKCGWADCALKAIVSFLGPVGNWVATLATGGLFTTVMLALSATAALQGDGSDAIDAWGNSFIGNDETGSQSDENMNNFKNVQSQGVQASSDTNNYMGPVGDIGAFAPAANAGIK